MSRAVPALPAILFLAAASIGCRNAGVVTGSYATLAEARQAGAIERGWIPPLVPSGAHDLREAHDPKSGRRWGLFAFTPSDEAPLRAAINPEPVSLDGRSCDVPRRIEWWPVMLRGRLEDDQVRATGLTAYLVRAPANLVVAINWKQRRAYYWSDAES